MSYDEKLAERVRDMLQGRPGMTQKRMFGGIAWLVDGNMSVVVRSEGDLMVRVAPDDHDTMLAEPGTATMVMRGRPLRGWITVAPDACATPSALTTWVERGLAYAATLPEK
ncbi:TfoX/Sxy family protein [Actinomadura madurae]|uniref:Transcriptional regulator of competence genes, TfoX/Sxy family n=1 Tax=Actinomadura madurae TaxID=1993 RepID=A0A1I4XVC7_9ACTN|nr:TfoX/Sxy family protein [Actinomadura madurae]SFN29199.1 Transcriptional regulator of competence genes, TfoX/Sxy family [Actinomadura madurae]SPT63633.1 Regulator of competence-specific genes [Actinomadura madurae]